jgi:nicotinamide/nicotinate riboside kinase
VTRTAKGELVQDWDSVGAIDVTLLSSILAFVRQHGTLPPRWKSKEDQNEATDSGVNPTRIQALMAEVGERLRRKPDEPPSSPQLTVAFIEGFLLYAPPVSPRSPNHILRAVHDKIDLPLFLPAPYDLVKARREARMGYVTVGPASTPDTTSEDAQERGMGKEEEGGGGKSPVVNLEQEADEETPPQNFWTDPPGYVDDIVWPRYVQYHAWLLLPGQDGGRGLEGLARDELLKLVGQGTNVRTDAGVVVALGNGRMPMTEVLAWAVKEVLGMLESMTRL